MMDNGTLSQEEIDALLNVSDDDAEETQTHKGQSGETVEVNEYLSSIEADTLGEIGNISFGTAATTLSTLLNQKVDITTPTVSIIKKPELYKSFPYEHVSVQVNYIEGFTGQNVLVIKSNDAAIISDIMLGGDGTSPDEELTDIHLSAIQEVMNQMMGSAATSMSTIFRKRINITPPEIEFIEDNESESIADDIDEVVFVKVSFQLKVGDLIDSSIMQVIPFPFAYELVEELLEGPTVKTEIEEKETAPILEQKDKSTSKELVKEKQQHVNSQSSPQQIGSPVEQTAPVQPATFSNFEQVELNRNEQRNLDMLLDIPLKVTVELGRTNRSIKEILEFASGSVIELDKLAGEPVDILANKKLIAQGEVVVIDENFGVRVTDVISQSDRLMQLK